MYRRIYVPSHLCTVAFMYRRIYVPSHLCTVAFMYRCIYARRIYVPSHLCTVAFMYRRIYVPSHLCTVAFMYRRIYVPWRDRLVNFNFSAYYLCLMCQVKKKIGFQFFNYPLGNTTPVNTVSGELPPGKLPPD